MKLAIAGDGAGEPLAKVLIDYYAKKPGYEVLDLSKAEDGALEFYAGIAERTAQAILAGKADKGILVCGTGIGVAMSANKVPGIRAAQTHDTYSAERAALSNNAQIITMGSRVIGGELAKAIGDAFLSKTFDENGSSAGNVAAVNALDQKYR